MTPQELTLEAQRDPHKTDNVQALGMAIVALGVYKEQFIEAGESAKKVNNALRILRILQNSWLDIPDIK